MKGAKRLYSSTHLQQSSYVDLSWDKSRIVDGISVYDSAGRYA